MELISKEEVLKLLQCVHISKGSNSWENGFNAVCKSLYDAISNMESVSNNIHKQILTVDQLYNLIDKSEEYWCIAIWSMDGMTEYGLANGFYKYEQIESKYRMAEVKSFYIGINSISVKIEPD